MPGMRRRPRNSSVSRPVPSHSSASTAGALPTGRSVTERRRPVTVLGAAALAVADERGALRGGLGLEAVGVDLGLRAQPARARMPRTAGAGGSCAQANRRSARARAACRGSRASSQPPRTSRVLVHGDGSYRTRARLLGRPSGSRGRSPLDARGTSTRRGDARRGGVGLERRRRRLVVAGGISLGAHAVALWAASTRGSAPRRPRARDAGVDGRPGRRRRAHRRERRRDRARRHARRSSTGCAPSRDRTTGCVDELARGVGRRTTTRAGARAPRGRGERRPRRSRTSHAMRGPRRRRGTGRRPAAPRAAWPRSGRRRSPARARRRAPRDAPATDRGALGRAARAPRSGD